MATDFQDRDFVNWPASIDFRPRHIFQPTSVMEVANVVSNAIQQNRRLRAFGSGWSFSDADVANDYLVDTSGLNQILAMSSGTTVWGCVNADGSAIAPTSPVLVSALSPGTLASSALLVHTQAGIKLRDLYTFLDTADNQTAAATRPRWALPTMGGAAGQALAGVVSTSTHGADFSLPPFPDIVRAIDIVMANGERHWFERADRPITTHVLLSAAFSGDPLSPTIHYDTDQFLSVLVAFGSMGIICSLIIEVVPQFGLCQRVGWTNWSKIRPLLISRALFSDKPPYPGISSVKSYPNSWHDDQGNTFDTSNAQPWAAEIIINTYRSSDNYTSDPNPDRDVLLVCRAKSSQFSDMPPPQGNVLVDVTVGSALGVMVGTLLAGPLGGLIGGILGGILGGLFGTQVEQVAKSIVDQAMLLIAINHFKANDATGVRGDVTTIINVAGNRNDSDGFFAAHQITDTYDYSVSNTSPLLSIELVVPTTPGRWQPVPTDVLFIDALLAAFDKIVANNVNDKFAGLFSVRYSQRSDALLAMQNFPSNLLDTNHVCHIEIGCLHNIDSLGNRIYGSENIVGLKDGNLCESSSRKHFLAFEALLNEVNGRLHWGQMSFTNSHNPQTYPNFPTWSAVRATFNNGFGVFDNDFTTRYGVSSQIAGGGWQVISSRLLPGAPTLAPADAAAAAAAMPPVGYLTSQNCIEVLVIGKDGQICWNRQEQPDGDFVQWSWVKRPDSRVDNKQSGSVSLAPQFGGRPATALNSDGHPEVFALCVSNTGIYHAWRGDVSDNTWNDWTQLKDDTGFTSSPDSVLAFDGFLIVAAVAGNKVRWTSQNSTLGIVGWNDWADLPALPQGLLPQGDPCMAVNGDAGNVVQMFIRTNTGTIFGISQTAASASSEWGAWQQIGDAQAQLTFAGSPAVGRNLMKSGLQLFVVDSNGQMQTIGQFFDPGTGILKWNQSWTLIVPAQPIAMASSSRPSVVNSGPAAAIQVAALAASREIIHYQQQAAGFSLTELGGKFSSEPGIVMRTNGALEVFAKFASDIVEHRVQTMEGGTFGW
jgi:hypothetical protein